MIKLLRLVIATCFAVTLQQTAVSQSLSVNTDGSAAHPSAILDVKSTTKGLLVPRLSKTEKNSIPLPATGLLIFQDGPDSTGFYYYNGVAWSWLNPASATTQWLTTGNAGIDPDNNFVGTTGPNSLRFRYGNIFSGQLNDRSTYFGYKAGLVNPGLIHNIGIGVSALQNNTGTNNTAIGDSALYNNNAGYNTAIGNSALRSNNIGTENTALGFRSMVANAGGHWNTAIGTYALSANTNATGNTATGYRALNSNTIGFENVATGLYSQYLNETGNYNTAVGTYSARNNTTGSGNVSLGYYANALNPSGSFNVAIGVEAMYASSASENVGIGFRTLHVVSGNRNTAVGYTASSSTTTGINNTAVGYNAGFAYTTGIHNTSLGAETYSGVNNNNYTAVGFDAGGQWSTGDNVVEIGNSYVTKIGGMVSWSIQSDKRIKTNINADVPGLAFINLLQPVTYNLDIHKQMEVTGRKKNKNIKPWNSMYDIEKVKMTGFLAQDVASAAKSIGYDFSGVDIPKKPNDLYSLRYADFVVPLVKAVQEQQQIIDKQQKAIDELRDQNKLMIKRLEKLENK